MQLKNFFRFLFYLAMFLYLIHWLHIQGYLVWVIAVLSVMYLIFYFAMGTFTVFVSSLEELGALSRASFSRSPLLTVVVLGVTVLLTWILALLFWPIFLVPDSAYLKNKEKYDAIKMYEQMVIKKYKK
ncbi:MAG: hypothetical protein ACXAC7_22890 [Candidatus Hodarchaeales archaeon]